MKDRRYTVRREYCGYAEPRWVARFCGDWIGQRTTRIAGLKLAEEAQSARSAALMAL